MIGPDEIATILRAQAWERAKAELHSMRHTYYGMEESYDQFVELVKHFIEAVENGSLND